MPQKLMDFEKADVLLWKTLYKYSSVLTVIIETFLVVSIVWKGNEDEYKDEKQDNSSERVVKEGGILVNK